MAVGTPNQLAYVATSDATEVVTTGVFTAGGRPLWCGYSGINVAPTFTMDGGVGAPSLEISRVSEFTSIYAAAAIWNSPGSGSRTITVSGPTYIEARIEVQDASGIDTTTPASGSDTDFTVSGGLDLDLTIVGALGDLAYGVVAAAAAITLDGTTLNNDQIGTTGRYFGSQTEPGGASVNVGATVGGSGTQAAAVGFNIEAASTGYTMTADAGSFAITGTAATLTYNPAVDAEAGSFAITGTDATLRVSRVVSAETGAVAITGTDAGFGLVRVADAGSWVITGTDATLSVSVILAAEAGSVAITGQDATLTYTGSFTITAESGSFAITGVAAGLAYSRAIDAETGALAIAGQDASLLWGHVLDAEAGAVAITGQAATLTYTPVTTARVLLPPHVVTAPARTWRVDA